MKLICLFFVFPTLAFSQATIKGLIVNKRTGDKIPYATVGLAIENIGTNALEDGSFELILSTPKPNDTLLFSSAGFETFKLLIINEHLSNIRIELSPIEINLPEVVIKNKQATQSVTLNDFTNCGNHFAGSNGFQTQLGQHFRTSEVNSMLTEIKICRLAGVFNPEKTIFRIRIYDMDTSTMAPSIDLCKEIIETKTSSRLVRINLSKYKIYIPCKDFFVAIEWLKISINEHKSVIKQSGLEKAYTGYRPSIGWTDNYNACMEAWSLDNRGNWKPMSESFNKKTSVAIAATVEY